MITANNIKPGSTARWFVLLLLILLIGLYGRPAMEWILMKLYEVLVERNQVK